jgi:hypothetical protein
MGMRSTSDYIILRLICLMCWSFIEVLKPIETYYVENIKSTNFILGNFIIIDKCKSVLFYRIWKLNKTIWNYFVSTCISNFHQYILNLLLYYTDHIILRLICLMYWSFLEVLKPSKTYYVENIKSTNFILGTNTKSTKL